MLAVFVKSLNIL